MRLDGRVPNVSGRHYGWLARESGATGNAEGATRVHAEERQRPLLQRQVPGRSVPGGAGEAAAMIVAIILALIAFASWPGFGSRVMKLIAIAILIGVAIAANHAHSGEEIARVMCMNFPNRPSLNRCETSEGYNTVDECKAMVRKLYERERSNPANTFADGAWAKHLTSDVGPMESITTCASRTIPDWKPE
jgi:hypothetical protein